jgi:hypothetical protein
MDVLAICAEMFAAGVHYSEWLVVIDTIAAFCALEDDECP